MRRRRRKQTRKKPSKSNGCVVYVRVSDRKQIENTSLDVQERTCRSLAKKKGLEVVSVFREEGRNAKSVKRPELQTLLTYCKEYANEIRAVVAYHRDRAVRKMDDYVMIVAKLEVLVAEYENKIKAVRVRECMAAAVTQRGVWPHQAPLGYLNRKTEGENATLVEDPVRAPLVAGAFEVMAEGRNTVASVARWATQQGLRTKQGRLLSSQAMKRLLENPIYAGWIDSELGYARGNFEPIVSEELFGRVQEVLTGRGYTAARHKLDTPDLPLRRFVR